MQDRTRDCIFQDYNVYIPIKSAPPPSDIDWAELAPTRVDRCALPDIGQHHLMRVIDVPPEHRERLSYTLENCVPLITPTLALHYQAGSIIRTVPHDHVNDWERLPTPTDSTGVGVLTSEVDDDDLGDFEEEFRVT